jgi:AraC-like DNA-binding protein
LDACLRVQVEIIPSAAHRAQTRQIGIGVAPSRRTPVVALAGQLGYQSEAAFSRPFKRHAGSSPGAVRRQAKDEADVA